jgi:hypothetical protein
MEKIKQFRKSFKDLPTTAKRFEVERLMRIVNRIPVTYLVLDGRSQRVMNIQEATKFLKDEGVARPDKSYIAKALKGERKSLYSFQIIQEFEYLEEEL